MALNINPPNFAGLSGGGSGAINLTVPGALGLQALQLKQAQEEALRKSILERMQIQQQGQLGLGQQNIQRAQLAQQGLLGQQQAVQMQQEMEYKNRALQQQGLLGQNEMALKSAEAQQRGQLGQAGLDVEKQKLQQESMHKHLAALMEENKETIKEKGALAAYGLVALKGAKTPEEAQQVREEIVNTAKAKKFISAEDAKALSGSPLSTFTNFLTHQAMTYDGIGKYKDAMDANKEKKSVSGLNATFEDGNLTSLSVDPTTATKTAAQKDLKDRNEALLELAPIRDEFKAKYFTNKNRLGQWLSKQAEENEGLSVVGNLAETAASKYTGKTTEERSKDIRESTKYLNSVEQFFNTKYKQPMTGAAVAKDELKTLRQQFLSGDMSPSEFLGAMDQILVKYTSEVEFNKNILKKGLGIEPSGQTEDYSKMTTEELLAEKQRLTGAK